MTEVQAHRSAKFDREVTGAIQYTPLMDSKAYTIVRAAFADLDNAKTYRLDTDPSSAMNYVEIKYRWRHSPSWRVTIADVYGTVISEEYFPALAEAEVIERVDQILREAGRA